MILGNLSALAAAASGCIPRVQSPRTFFSCKLNYATLPLCEPQRIKRSKTADFNQRSVNVTGRDELNSRDSERETCLLCFRETKSRDVKAAVQNVFVVSIIAHIVNRTCEKNSAGVLPRNALLYPRCFTRVSRENFRYRIVNYRVGGGRLDFWLNFEEERIFSFFFSLIKDRCVVKNRSDFFSKQQKYSLKNVMQMKDRYFFFSFFWFYISVLN